MRHGLKRAPHPLVLFPPTVSFLHAHTPPSPPRCLLPGLGSPARTSRVLREGQGFLPSCAQEGAHPHHLPDRDTTALRGTLLDSPQLLPVLAEQQLRSLRLGTRTLTLAPWRGRGLPLSPHPQTCRSMVRVSTATHSRLSSPQHPPHRHRGTQGGLKMCSASRGNSLRTSTSVSRARQ